MATGGRIKTSVIVTSDVIHDFPCFSCSQVGRNTEALYQCDDCQQFYCRRCSEIHNKHTANISEITTTEKEQCKNCLSPSQSVLTSETCEDHQGKLIEMFCEEHNEVCCVVCIATKHRSCKRVEYIPNIPKKLLQSIDREQVRSNLEEVTRGLRDLKSKQSAFLKELNQQRDDIIKEIQQFKTHLVNRVAELERSSVSDVENKHKTISDDMNHDMKKVDQMLKDVETQLSNVKKANTSDDDAKHFVNMKLAEQQAFRGMQCKTNLFGKPLETIGYELDLPIEKYLKELVSVVYLHVSRRTMIPFVNILIPGIKRDVTKFLASFIQDELLNVGIHSKFINPSEIDADVYTVVVISGPDDLYILRQMCVQNQHCKVILFILDQSRCKPRTMMEKIGDHMVKFEMKLKKGSIVDYVSKTIYLSVTCTETGEYICNLSDGARALKMVLDTINE